MSWGFRRGKSPKAVTNGGTSGGSTKAFSKSQVDDIPKELEQLRVMNEQLKEQLKAMGMQIGDYLYRYQPLLGAEWELQFVVLSGTTLKMYKSHKDMVYNPNEEISMLGCTLDWEGMKQGRYWALSIADPGGNTIVRLAALSSGVAMKWLERFGAVGCTNPDCSGSSSDAGTSGHGSKRQGARDNVLRRNSSEGMLPEMQTKSPTANKAKNSHTRRSSLQLTSLQEKSLKSVASAQKGAGDSSSEAGLPLVSRSVSEPPKPAGKTAQLAGASHTGVMNGREKDGVSGVAELLQAPPVRRTNTHLPMSGSTPVHLSARSSFLSSERIWHEKHTGLYNLAAVVLFAANFRLALENLLKYGWRYNPLKLLPSLTVGNSNILLASCYPALLAITVLSLGIEKLAYRFLASEQELDSSYSKRSPDEVLSKSQRQKIDRLAATHEWVVFCVVFVLTTASLVIPCYVISNTNAEPIASITLLMISCILWMKLISFHHCCWDLRAARRGGVVIGLSKPTKPGALMPGERGSPGTPDEWALLAYPYNLTVSNVAYFVAAPTLVYQVNYPRSPTIRKKWILRRLVELLFMLTFMTIIIHQFVEPSVHSAMQPLREMNWPHVVERVLKLALPSTYAWLCMFYCLFHLWLNIIAELTRFGDREFYKDWWNASTVGEYWRMWNMPVHKWLLRHVYFPAIRLGLSRTSAMVLVFFVSAFFHELLLGVPLHVVRFWVFTGMMMQIPLAHLSEYMKNKMKRDDLGNIFFWFSFCVVGQPVCVLLYAHDFLLAAKQA